MSEFTPSDEQLRMAWILEQWDSKGQLRSEGSDDEFDRWLAKVKTEAWGEAVQALAWATDHGPDPLTYVAEHNPYRATDE